jgi:hypothetical protein
MLNLIKIFISVILVSQLQACDTNKRGDENLSESKQYEVCIFPIEGLHRVRGTYIAVFFKNNTDKSFLIKEPLEGRGYLLTVCKSDKSDRYLLSNTSLYDFLPRQQTISKGYNFIGMATSSYIPRKDDFFLVATNLQVIEGDTQPQRVSMQFELESDLLW